MTNYNERLEEILANLGERHIMVEHRLVHLGMPEQNGKDIETREAKQAITSLIKELVAEAINSECLALLNDLEEEQAACYSNHHKNSETFVPFVSLDTIQKAKEKYFEIAKRRIEEATK